MYDELNHTVQCTLYSATYNATITYENNIQFVQVDVVEHGTILNSDQLYNGLGIPFDVNLFALHEAVVSCLAGWFAVEITALYVYTEAPLWAGVATYSNETLVSWPDDLSVKVEELMINLTLSLITLRDDPDPEVSTIIVNTTVPGILTTYPPVYAYSKVVLWQIYGTALGISVTCVVLGTYMLLKNSTAGQLSFSQILVATRNPTLDRIADTSDQSSLRLLQNTTLRYGTLEGTEHVCFGVPDEISESNGRQVLNI